jgi:hypothetical protein
MKKENPPKKTTVKRAVKIKNLKRKGESGGD